MKQNKEILFCDLCKIFESISNISNRLEIQKILSDFFKENLDKEHFYMMLFLCTCSVYPDYKNYEIGVGEGMVISCVAETTGLAPKNVREDFFKIGDLGTIAMKKRVRQLFISNTRLTCCQIFNSLQKLCHISGKSANKVRKSTILSIINDLNSLETKYYVRMLEGKLKIGLALATVLISLAQAYSVEVEKIKEAYNKNPDFEILIEMIRKHGAKNFLTHCIIKPLIPLKPMLASPVSSISQIFTKFKDSEILSEYKYDGERIQIHHRKNIKENSNATSTSDVRLKNKILKDECFKDFDNFSMFSRNGENITEKYKDLLTIRFPEESFIIDGEVVAFENGTIRSFQLLSTRKRKKIEEIEVQVCLFVFDIIYFDGEELINKPLSVRREILHKYFEEIVGRLMFATFIVTNNIEEIETFFKKAIDNNMEGLVIKDLNTPYIPSHRSNKWIKLKKDYLDEFGDSLDLVIIGAYYGKGKRTGTYGGFLLGSYNNKEGMYEACCKIGTGFTDENLQDFYQKLVVTADNSNIISKVIPDVWIVPEYVIEVKAASLSVSPIYTAGEIDGKGISLRFPRFIRERRDKSIEDATSVTQLIGLYQNVLYDDKNIKIDEVDEDEFN